MPGPLPPPLPSPLPTPGPPLWQASEMRRSRMKKNRRLGVGLPGGWRGPFVRNRTDKPSRRWRAGRRAGRSLSFSPRLITPYCCMVCVRICRAACDRICVREPASDGSCSPLHRNVGGGFTFLSTEGVVCGALFQPWPAATNPDIPLSPSISCSPGDASHFKLAEGTRTNNNTTHTNDCTST